MTTITSLFTAGALALTPLLGSVAPVYAQEAQVNFVTDEQDPFEVSKRNCVDQGWMDSVCVTITGEFIQKYGEKSLCELVEGFGSTLDRFRGRNGWGEEVTCNTSLKVGDTFAFG